jgi:hypothetical protein
MDKWNMPDTRLTANRVAVRRNLLLQKQLHAERPPADPCEKIRGSIFHLATTSPYQPSISTIIPSGSRTA